MSSVSTYRTQRYSQPRLLIPVMEPTTSPETLGLAANRYVISQSSCPRFDPDAPMNSTSPALNPRNGALLTVPGEIEQSGLVGSGHQQRIDVVRLAEVVDRDGDVHALDAVLRDADRASEVWRRSRRGIRGDGGQCLRDMLRAATGIE